MRVLSQDAEKYTQPQEKISSVSTTRARPGHKGWRVLDRNRLLNRQRRTLKGPAKFPVPRLRSSRQINLNKAELPLKASSIEPEASSSSELRNDSLRSASSDLKRKHGACTPDETPSVHVNNVAGEENKSPVAKKQKQSERTSELRVQVGETETVNEGETGTESIRLIASSGKAEKERQRQKKKKKRQKAEKQARNEEHRLLMEVKARRAEAESSEPKRHFRKKDLTLNDILPVPIETLLEFGPARLLYDSLMGPIYFSVSCKQSVVQLRERLKGAIVCSKLLVVSEEYFNEVIIQKSSGRGCLPRLLDMQTLSAIDQVLEDAQPPHNLESSQNAEDKIKCLFKPILRSLGLQDTIITTGFNWKEKIGLRSSIDLGAHDYAPKSDVAIIKLLNDKEAKIVVLFEAYSRLGQSLTTADENRADRVRLLIQGSYISIRDERPSVVFYLTRDKYMETILIFSADEDQRKFSYYAEKQPFYNEVAWVDLVCQIVNLI